MKLWLIEYMRKRYLMRGTTADEVFRLFCDQLNLMRSEYVWSKTKKRVINSDDPHGDFIHTWYKNMHDHEKSVDIYYIPLTLQIGELYELSHDYT